MRPEVCSQRVEVQRADHAVAVEVALAVGAAGVVEVLGEQGEISNINHAIMVCVAGENEKGLLLLLCERAAGEFSSPNCLAVDRPLGRNLIFSYRFKRAYLARWREMSAGVDALIARFETIAKNSAGP